MELVARIHLGWKRQVARDLVPYGVNPKQIYLLRKLREVERMAPSEIAELLYADRPTVTSMLNTMERAGWISRRRDPVSAKQVIVAITSKGSKKLESVPQQLWRTGRIRATPEDCLNAAERAELVRLLEKMNASVEDMATRGRTS